MTAPTTTPATVPANGRRMIEVRDVYKSFGQLEVLRGVTMHVGAGEVVVVLGPSGSGKSTLLRCVNRLESVDRGEVIVDGRPVSDPKLNVNELSREIGVVFQAFNLFPDLTVMENLCLAPMKDRGLERRPAEESGRRVREKVGIPEKAGARPAQLSGGQQQRVAIARALCMEPKIMLFDEPTSALDPEMITEVLDVMQDLAREGMTMMVVSHEMGFARGVANRIVFMDRSEIVEQGTPREFCGSPREERPRRFLSNILPR